MASIATIRIGCNTMDFDAPRDVRTGRSPTFWKGNDLQFELAVFERATLQSLGNISRVILAIKPMGPNGTAPDISVLPLMRGEALASSFDTTVTEETWNDGSKQQICIHFSADESSIAAQDAWLVIWGETVDDPEKIITFSAGRICIYESSGGIDLTPPQPTENFYTRKQCDTLFAKRMKNLQDLSDMEMARQHLQLGAAAIYGVKNETDMQSDSSEDLPTQHSVKSYVDISIASIPIGGSDGNYCLANCAFYCNSNGTSFPISGNVMSPLSDGWVAHQFATSSATNVTISLVSAVAAFDLNFMRIIRARYSLASDPICIYRPLLPMETFPLIGKTVTFSVDMMVGTGFPNTETNGINISITATTNAAAINKIDSNGEFIDGNATIATFDPVYNIQTDSYGRYSFTFSIPEDAVQICLRIVHIPYGTGSSIPNNYEYRIYRPALGIGSEEQAFHQRGKNEDSITLGNHYQRTFAAFTGEVEENEVIEQRLSFLHKFSFIPVCIRCVDANPVNVFVESQIGDATEITIHDSLISRTALTASSAGTFRTFYYFIAPLW
ncbi:MAG: hypothetical protein LBG86_00885 [Puniceicoccales bacterium]|jgi:hypothetical protein|nr:hypothetical protein [Puniceicoccales bacterium]